MLTYADRELKPDWMVKSSKECDVGPEHHARTEANAADRPSGGNDVHCSDARRVNEPPARLDSDGETIPKDQKTERLIEQDLSFNQRLRAARAKLELSRPGAAQRLKNHGVQITPDAIKKHEEGAAKPRAEVRRAYAELYKTSEAALFD